MALLKWMTTLSNFIYRPTHAETNFTCHPRDMLEDDHILSKRVWTAFTAFDEVTYSVPFTGKYSSDVYHLSPDRCTFAGTPWETVTWNQLGGNPVVFLLSTFSNLQYHWPDNYDMQLKYKSWYSFSLKRKIKKISSSHPPYCVYQPAFKDLMVPCDTTWWGEDTNCLLPLF